MLYEKIKKDAEVVPEVGQKICGQMSISFILVVFHPFAGQNRFQRSREDDQWAASIFFHPLSLPTVQKLRSCEIFSPSKSCIFKKLSLRGNFLSVSSFLICALTKSPGQTSGSAEHTYLSRKCGAEPPTRLLWSDPTVMQPHSLTHTHVTQL